MSVCVCAYACLHACVYVCRGGGTGVLGLVRAHALVCPVLGPLYGFLTTAVMWAQAQEFTSVQLCNSVCLCVYGVCLLHVSRFCIPVLHSTG